VDDVIFARPVCVGAASNSRDSSSCEEENGKRGRKHDFDVFGFVCERVLRVGSVERIKRVTNDLQCILQCNDGMGE